MVGVVGNRIFPSVWNCCSWDSQGVPGNRYLFFFSSFCGPSDQLLWPRPYIRVRIGHVHVHDYKLTRVALLATTNVSWYTLRTLRMLGGQNVLERVWHCSLLCRSVGVGSASSVWATCAPSIIFPARCSADHISGLADHD